MMSDFTNLTVPNLPEPTQQFESMAFQPSEAQATPAATMESSSVQFAKPVEQKPPPGYHSTDEPVVMPPPFSSRIFKHKKRVVTGKEASINMIMNSLNIRRDTIEAVNQVQEVISAENKSVAASDNVSACSRLGPHSQKMSQSCFSLKSVGNVSATSSHASNNTDYGLGPNIPSLTFQDGDEVNVVLLEVLNPSMFWVRPEGAELDTLLEAMS
jgi:hypothetical protein